MIFQKKKNEIYFFLGGWGVAVIFSGGWGWGDDQNAQYKLLENEKQIKFEDQRK